MHRLAMLVVGLACALAVVALVAAQDTQEPADATDACATPADGTPTTATGTPAATPDASPEACPSPEATTVAVELFEMAFTPSELTIPANTDVTVELTNTGASAHDFVIDELGISSGTLDPGSSTTVTVNAPAGSYEYYCSMPGHRQAGMVGTLTVQ